MWYLWGRELNMDFDIAIVGSGFGGAFLAMIARRLGRSVIMLEKGRHPRFAIGESSTPLSNLLVEELATRYDLPKIASLVEWGKVRRAYPEIACGLKRGFTFYHHDFETPFVSHDNHDNELLIAASPCDEIADTHWFRADFDHLFVREAIAAGSEYLDEVKLDRFSQMENEVVLEGTRHGKSVTIKTRFVVDATGPRGFLHRALGLREVELPGYPATQTLFSHFSGVERFEDIHPYQANAVPPYPADDAAVHHVFDGGWIWVLRFNNGITSAGVAAVDSLARSLHLVEGAPAWQRLLDRMPILRESFAPSKAEREFTYAPRLSFRSGAIVGERWALLPSAAGFVDPLLSTGFALTLLGVSRLAAIFETAWESERLPSLLQTYAQQTDSELLATSRLIASLYANMNHFPSFSALTMLYFAAASYSEAVRRLGRPELAGSYLLSSDPYYGPALGSLCERALYLADGQRGDLVEDILRAIAPINIGRFGDPMRNNWYPVDSEDLIKAAGKLHADAREIYELLRKSGLAHQYPVFP
jgi:tetracycline 7-halogenase / FADH2 O2-dependent halogenase